MGQSSSKYEHTHSIRNKLRNMPFSRPTDRDYDFLVYQTGLDRSEVVGIIENHLLTHPDGRMNRKEFCDLYHLLRKETSEIVQGLSENIFKALGVKSPEADLITMNEFLITYALTSRGDMRKKLEYAFELYDTNHDNALELEEVREAVYGILELFEPPKEPSIGDIAKECVKDIRITCVVKKRN